MFLKSNLDDQLFIKKRNSENGKAEPGNLTFISQKRDSLYPCEDCNKAFPKKLLSKVTRK